MFPIKIFPNPIKFTIEFEQTHEEKIMITQDSTAKKKNQHRHQLNELSTLISESCFKLITDLDRFMI